MAKAANAKSRRRVKRLYFSAKISDYQFKKVLWHFVLDHSAVEASRHVNLSANSISSIYAKLRKFFFDYGLFRDIYKGGDPKSGTGRDDEVFEFALLDFHLKRVAKKHGALDSPMGEHDYHFAESFWRFHYRHLVKERPTEIVQRMMLDHLTTFIRTFGPVGTKHKASATDSQAGQRLALSMFDQVLVWLERNAARFQGKKSRAGLREVRTLNGSL